jgi:diguanylate cyclase
VLLVYVVLWVLPSVLVAVTMGVYIGRAMRPRGVDMVDEERLQQEREKTLQAMQVLLKCTDQLTTDVDSHNTDLHEAERSIDGMELDGELGIVQSALLTQISSVLQANRRLEHDLVCAKYELNEQTQELDRARKEARTDQLSGIANRKAFDERLDYLLSINKRHGTTFSLIICDVDRFKWINDTHGHQAGDRVVNGLGQALLEQIRETDFAGRFGGDEFALLLHEAEPQWAGEVGNRIRQIIERRNFNVGRDGERLAVTLSMGLTSVRADDTAELIIARADEALYRSKQGGRNQLNIANDVSELVAAEA